MSLTQYTGKIIEKGTVTNTAITLNTNLFATGLTPVRKPLSDFLIYACFQSAGKLKVFRTVAGVTLAGEILNADADLAANAAYVFAVPISYAETINLQFTANATITKLVVMEDLS